MRRTLTARKEIKDSKQLKQLRNMFLPSLTKMAELNGVDLSKLPDDTYFKIYPHMIQRNSGYDYAWIELSATKKLSETDDKNFFSRFSYDDCVCDILGATYRYTQNQSYIDLCSFYADNFASVIYDYNDGAYEFGDQDEDVRDVVNTMTNHPYFDSFVDCYGECVKILDVFNKNFYRYEHSSLKEFKNYLYSSFKKKVSEERPHLINLHLIVDKNIEKFEYCASATIWPQKKMFANNVFSGLNLICGPKNWDRNNFLPVPSPKNNLKFSI